MSDNQGAGVRIAKALRDAGVRPADLARHLRVSQPTVHGWVNQLHGITWANARRVAAALQVSPGWIMFGADEEAERIAQTHEELGFLRLFRGLDDIGQASILRLMAAMPEPSKKKRGPPERPPTRPRPRGSVEQSAGRDDSENVVRFRSMEPV